MKKIFNSIWGFCFVLVLLTGCYREDVAYIHNHIDNLELRSITDQIEAMKDGIADLQALQEQITPVVKALEDAKDGIHKDITALLARIDAGETLSTELQAQLISLQSQFNTLDAAYRILNESKLPERTEELEALVSSFDGGLGDRLTSLETAAQAFATAEAVAELKAVVDVLPTVFDGLFDDALKNCEQSIIQWISESQAFTDIFQNFYNVSEMDRLLNILREVDAARANDLSALKKSAENAGKEIRDIVNDAVNGTTKKIGERMEAVDAGVDELSSRVNGLLARVEALEKLYDVVGDYEFYESNLISDIRALQEIIGENGTLVSLVNTLKLILSQSGQSFYDLEKIVDDISSVSGGLSSSEEKLKSYEELVKTLASVEQFNAVGDKFLSLSSAVGVLESESKLAIESVQTLVQRVDDIVAKWSDATFDQVSSNAADIVKLKEEDARLNLALENVIKEGEDRDDKNHKEILELISKVNESIAALKVEEYIQKTGLAQKAVDEINSLLEACEVGEIKGLQDILSSLDASMEEIDGRIKAIWDVIGTETLSIEGSLINAINVLYSRFGGVEGINGFSGTLENDLALIQNVLKGIIGDDAQGQTLTSLRILLEDLSDRLSGKADKSALPGIESDIASIQKALFDYASELDDKLETYLKSADADKKFATIVLLGSLIESYETYVGDYDEAFVDGTGTVIAAVAALENRIGELESSISSVAEKIEGINGVISDIDGIIGTGSIGQWASDLIVAVNYLYSLVGDESVSQQVEAIALEQSTSIAESMINTLVETILGNVGDAKDIAALLNGFDDSFSGFSESLGKLADSVGDISGLQDAKNPDIVAMIKNIRTELTGFAEIGHGHEIADVTGLQDALDSLTNYLSAVSAKFELLDAYVKGTFEDSINALASKFEGYTTPDYVHELIAAAENILVSAILSANSTNSTLNGYFANLNLEALSDAIQDILDTEINDIIKENGTIDTKTKSLIDAAISLLDLNAFFKAADLPGSLNPYAMYEDSQADMDVKTSIEVLTAFAALSIELETGNTYSYTDFGTAVKHIYELLLAHISDCSASQDSFNELKSRVDAIKPMLGDGFSSSKTVADVLGGITGTIEDLQGTIEDLEDLFGDLGTGNTVKSLVDKLQGLYDALVAALIGDGSIDSDHSLSSFKNRLDAIQTGLEGIGFETIKNSENKSLAKVISDIDDKIDGIWAIIGEGYDKDNSLADAIGGLNKDLEGLVKTSDFTSRTGPLSDRLAALLAALGGESALTSLSGLSDKLDVIQDRLDDFNDSDKTVEENLSSLQNSINTLFDIVDLSDTELKGTLVENLVDLKTVAANLQVLDDTDLTEISKELTDITLEIVMAKIRTGLYDDSRISGLLVILRILMELSDWRQADWVTEWLADAIQDLAAYANINGNLGRLDLEAESLVDALNQLYGLLGVTKTQLDSLKNVILGGSEVQSLKALTKMFNELKSLVGAPTDSRTVFEALAKLEDTVNSFDMIFGENTTGYSDVWSAISDLNAALIGNIYRINSLVFIPDYQDGMATYGRGGVSMTFTVNASPAFFERDQFKGEFSVNGYLKTAYSRGKGEAITGTASLSGDTLTVEYSFSEPSGNAQLAVAIVDGVGEVFISDYISLHL